MRGLHLRNILAEAGLTDREAPNPAHTADGYIYVFCLFYSSGEGTQGLTHPRQLDLTKPEVCPVAPSPQHLLSLPHQGWTHLTAWLCSQLPLFFKCMVIRGRVGTKDIGPVTVHTVMLQLSKDFVVEIFFTK